MSDESIISEGILTFRWQVITRVFVGSIISQAIADFFTVIIAAILFRTQLYKEFH